MSEHECIVCGYMHDPDALAQADENREEAIRVERTRLSALWQARVAQAERALKQVTTANGNLAAQVLAAHMERDTLRQRVARVWALIDAEPDDALMFRDEVRAALEGTK